MIAYKTWLSYYKLLENFVFNKLSTFYYNAILGFGQVLFFNYFLEKY